MPNRVAFTKKEKKKIGNNEYLRGYREKEPSFTVGGNVNKHHGDSAKN